MKRFLSPQKVRSSPRAIRLGPTEQLLLLCSRLELSNQEAERLKLLTKESIDWQHFFDLASYHRVFALAYRNLKRHVPDAFPAEIESRFTEKVGENQQHILELTGELLQIASAFEERSIPLLPLKGPALAASVYGNVGLRPAGDLDLLVNPEDVPAALEILRSAGYSVVLYEPGAFATRAQEAAVCRYLYHFILYDEERELVVELHFNLSPRKMPFPVKPSELLKRSSRFPIGGREIRIPHPMDNLIFLCVHGSKHAWSRLEWLVGIAELLKKMQPFDEQKLFQLAAKRNAERPLLLGLLLAFELLETDVTPTLQVRAAADPAIRKLADRAIERIPEREEDPKIQSRFQLALCPTVAARLRWLFYSSLQPGHADIRYIDLKRLSLYYLIRPIRLARKVALG